MESQNLDRVRFVTQHFNDLQGLRYRVPLGLITLSLGGATYFSSWPMPLRGAFILAAFILMFRAKAYYRRTFGEVEPAPGYVEELESLSFSPVGPTSRIQGFQRLPPYARHVLSTVGLALALFAVFQAITPTIRVEEGDLLGKRYQIGLDSVVETNPSWTQGVWAIIEPNPLSGSTVRAVGGQMMLVLYGSFFLGVWLWRERRPSQRHYLALGAVLLGLATIGTFLGYLVWTEGKVIALLDPLIPALVHPWVALLLCGAAMILAGLIDHWQLVRVFKPAVEEYS
jgi:hypothetical protein